MRVASDPALEDTMLLVGRVSSHPAIVMQLDDQVAVPRRLEDRVLDLVEAGGLVGRSEEDGRLLRVQPPLPKEPGLVVIAALQDVIQLGQTDQVHLAPMQDPRFPKPVDPILALHEDLITVPPMPGQVAIQNVLDAGTVIQEAQQGVPVLLGVLDRVSHDDDIEAPLFPREAISLPFPLRDQRGPVADIDEEAAAPLFIEREVHVVPLVLPEQLDDRIEGGLVINKANLEEEPDFAHPHLSLRFTRTTAGAPARTRRPPACRYRSSGYLPAQALRRTPWPRSGGGRPR